LIAGYLAALVPGFFAFIDEVYGYFLVGPTTIFNDRKIKLWIILERPVERWLRFNNCVVLFQVNFNQVTMILYQTCVMNYRRLGGFLSLLRNDLAQSLIKNDLTKLEHRSIAFDLELESSAFNVESGVSDRVPSIAVELRMHFAEAYPLAIDFVKDLDLSRVSLRAIVRGLEADSVDPQILIIVHFNFYPRFIALSHVPFVKSFVTVAQQV
jgi:hypothetical protein